MTVVARVRFLSLYVVNLVLLLVIYGFCSAVLNSIMKLFTNLGNTASLKILISASFGGKQVQIEYVTIDDARFQHPRRLPVLEVENGVHIFSTNAAANLLFPPSPNNVREVDSWLDWEAVQLQPTVLKHAGAKEVSPQLLELLNELDNKLGKQNYLVKKSITVSDISIWTTLFPVFSDSKASSAILDKYKNVSKWYITLEDLAQFKSALATLNPEKGLVGLQNLQAATWYPSTAPVQPTGTNQKESQNQKPTEQSQQSPTADVTTKEPIVEEDLKSAEDAWKRERNVKPKAQVTPVLPKPGERNVLVTSALPYVNNVPHLGNIIGCVLSADVFARYSRLRNWNTLYISGTDEYGTATETKALEENLTPQEICDKYFAIHKDIYSWFNIGFDYFGRTTTPEQTEVVQEMFKKCYDNGYMSTASVEQLLCENCSRFLADRFVEGICPRCKYEDARGDQCDGCGHLINAIELIEPRCKVCKQKPVVRLSEQLFIELPKVEEKVKTWLESVCNGWSPNAKVIAKSWLKDGLKPRCITRDLKWGIPVPMAGFENKVFYVWFDAPIGYLSITKKYSKDWRKWWEYDNKTEVSLYQFMAKDNVPFHSIMFPSTLFAAGGHFNMVKHLMATEYLNYEDGKFSKSRGVGVFGNDAKETGIPSDVFRFYLLYVRPESQDSSFSWLDLAVKNNNELLNNLGNFVNRALMFVEKFFNGVMPEMYLNNEDYTLLAQVTRELRDYLACLDKAKLRDGLRAILAVGRHANQYMQFGQPWVHIKGNNEDKKRAGTVVALSSNIACLLAVMLKPYMPKTAEIMAEQLNAPADVFVLTSEVSMLLPPGHKIGKPSPLFAKIEQATVDKFKARFAGKQQTVVNGSQANDKKTEEVSTSHNHVATTQGIAEMEAAVAKQGDLVRQMKASGASKTEWQPHVNVLLDMKKQLAEMKATASKSVQGNTANVNADKPSVSELEEKIKKQGDLVRQIKASGASKAEWQPHVNVLLDLKKQLAEVKATVSNPAPVEGNNANPNKPSVSELEEKIMKQGVVVRKLKASGVPRSDWQPELNILLDLKKQLAELQKT